MDTTAILSEIEKLPVEQQVVLVQRVWDSMAEIRRRSAELDANPDIAIPWEEVKRSLEDRRRG